MSDAKEAALRFVEAGLSVLPIRPDGSKAPLGPWKRAQRHRATADDVAAWPETCGVAVVCGEISGHLVVFDFDDPDAFPEWCAALPPDLLARLPRVLTPSDGMHVFARAPREQRTRKLAMTAAGKVRIELKAEGGYVLAVGSPPACHPAGRPYVLDGGPDLRDVPVLADDELDALLTAAALLDLRLRRETPRRTPHRPRRAERWASAALAGVLADLASTDEGDRNNALNVAAFRLGRLVAGDHLDEPDVRRALEDAGLAAGLGEAEVRRTVASGLRAGVEAGAVHPAERTRTVPGQPDVIAPNRLTELGNAERLARERGRDFRYCPGLGWLAWDGRRWDRSDDQGPILGAAEDVAREIRREAEDARADADVNPEDADKADLAKTLTAWAKNSETARAIRGSLALVPPMLRVHVDDLDADPMRLNARNGTVDLRTGELHAHRREDLCTRLAGCAYYPEATAPRWQRFLREVFVTEDLVAFVRRSLGLALTADVREHHLWVAFGSGHNGKSTLTGRMLGEPGRPGVLGDYATAAAPKLLCAARGDRHPTQLADLAGRRFVLASESGEDARLDEELVKWLTGGDVVKARRMRQDFFDVKPTWHLWLQTNHRPQIRGTDQGIWRRVLLVPFVRRFEGATDDKGLAAALDAEHEGILADLVRGCLEWQRDGLRPPAAVLAATDAYRAEEDGLRAFLEQHLEASPSMRAPCAAVYARYREWAVAAGEEVVSQRMLSKMLQDRGHATKKGTAGRRCWHGLALVQRDEREDDR